VPEAEAENSRLRPSVISARLRGIDQLQQNIGRIVIDQLQQCLMVWYGMVPLLPRGPQSLRRSGGSWIGRRLSMLRLSPFRPRLFGDGFRCHRDRRQR
jgi:hypothetical protein